MPGLRVQLKKQMSSAKEVRGTDQEFSRMRDLWMQVAALQAKADANEAERKLLRQHIEQHTEQLAAIEKQMELMMSRDGGLKKLLAEISAEREEFRRLFLDANRDRDDLHHQSEDIYAALYALHAKVSEMERNGSNGGADTKVDDKAAQYSKVVRRIREVARTYLPRHATVIVAAKGDDELLRLYGRRAWHFPQTENGVYAGHHPSSSTAAIVQLEVLRARGADHLLLPNTMFWWLDHYVEFKRYLETYYDMVVRQEDACLIFSLRGADPSTNLGWQSLFFEAIDSCQGSSDQLPSVLDWNTELDLASKFPELPIFSPPKTEHLLPYMDETIDVVAIASTDFISRTEAQRVAKAAVVSFSRLHGSENNTAVEIEWKPNVTAAKTLTSSIVMPCSNNLVETETSFVAVRDTLPRSFKGEIVLIDTAATKEFSEGLRRLAKSHPCVRILRHRKANGFLRACNDAAKTAKSDILVFLSNAVLPLANWFPPLLTILLNYPKAGAVGGKLIYSDGTLEQAGGITFSDGSIASFGNSDSQVDAPLYNFVREVDYCSVTVLATRRLLFEELNGFDEAFHSLDYAAADYGLKVRRKDYQVFYQPESASTYINRYIQGADSFDRDYEDQRNGSREIFMRRWRNWLKQRPALPPQFNLSAWQELTAQLYQKEGNG